VQHLLRRPFVVLTLVLSVAAAGSAQQPAPAAAARTDVYHVHFTKAVPGQAAALGKFLSTPDPAAPQPGHFIVLRHQQGDDWDYAVIEHLGPKATVDAAPTAPNPGQAMRAWHTDTFVAGPPWADFARAMGLSDLAGTANSVYTVAVWRAAPGQQPQLEKVLGTLPQGSKSQQVLMQHVEGGPWQFLAVSRHNSWQDFAADQAGPAPSAAASPAPDGWSDVRQYSTYHHDTLADRIAPK
jgi:hypothetical protein